MIKKMKRKKKMRKFEGKSVNMLEMSQARPHRKTSHFDIFNEILGKTVSAARDYYGAPLGPLSQLHHGVSGDVYAVDSRTLFIKNFNYDGEGPGKCNAIQPIEFSVNQFHLFLT